MEAGTHLSTEKPVTEVVGTERDVETARHTNGHSSSATSYDIIPPNGFHSLGVHYMGPTLGDKLPSDEQVICGHLQVLLAERSVGWMKADDVGDGAFQSKM
ncbi:oxidoreductase [Penicillium cf. viridicatum]|uniref:Oxidoreductase n=1 Tax=Penicillium cf. viridicatum TaxID=2972119 RepID=A0A9W9N5W8_9EURO|nr:oxidoreductase [Penicillium cf. viridicatum]